MRNPLLAAVAALTLLGAPAARAESVLPFIDDAYDKALVTARQQRRPIFIEAWAPW